MEQYEVLDVSKASEIVQRNISERNIIYQILQKDSSTTDRKQKTPSLFEFYTIRDFAISKYKFLFYVDILCLIRYVSLQKSVNLFSFIYNLYI